MNLTKLPPPPIAIKIGIRKRMLLCLIRNFEVKPPMYVFFIYLFLYPCLSLNISGCICQVKSETDKQTTDKWVTAANLTVKASRHQDECPLAFQRIGNKCYFYGYFKVNHFNSFLVVIL